MPSRFEKHKPDPAIRRNTLRARANMQDSKGEGAVVVAGSLAATIAAWVLLSLPGSPTAAPAQVSDTNQTAITVTAQTADNSNSSTSSGLLSIVTSTSTATATPQASLASGAASLATDSSQSATTSQAITSSSSAQAPQAVAVTRSSR